MGGRSTGRPRLPTALKAIRGTLQPCRQNPDEPMGTPGEPPMPDWLDEHERAFWPGVVAYLSELGVLRTEHGDAVAMLVCAKARYVRAKSEIDRVERLEVPRDLETETIEALTRHVAGERRELNDATDRYHRMLTAFGADPASASKVMAVKKPEAARKETAVEAMRRRLGG